MTQLLLQYINSKGKKEEFHTRGDQEILGISEERKGNTQNGEWNNRKYRDILVAKTDRDFSIEAKNLDKLLKAIGGESWEDIIGESFTFLYNKQDRIIGIFGYTCQTTISL